MFPKALCKFDKNNKIPTLMQNLHLSCSSPIKFPSCFIATHEWFCFKTCAKFAQLTLKKHCGKTNKMFFVTLSDIPCRRCYYIMQVYQFVLVFYVCIGIIQKHGHLCGLRYSEVQCDDENTCTNCDNKLKCCLM